MPAIASRYARALADVALDPKSNLAPEDAAAGVRAFEALLETSNDLRNVLISPAVPPARKRAVIKELGERLRIASLTRNFILVVVDHRRILMLGEIREALERLLDEHRGIVRAEVSSALELSGSQRETITAQLSRMTGKGVRSEFSVDPDLVGGMIARIGSTVYDGSVRGQLQTLRRKLIGEV